MIEYYLINVVFGDGGRECLICKETPSRYEDKVECYVCYFYRVSKKVNIKKLCTLQGIERLIEEKLQPPMYRCYKTPVDRYNILNLYAYTNTGPLKVSLRKITHDT